MVSISVITAEEEAHRRGIGATLSAAAEGAGHPFAPEFLDLKAHVDGVEVGGLAGRADRTVGAGAGTVTETGWVAVGAETGNEAGRVRCDWGLGILAWECQKFCV